MAQPWLNIIGIGEDGLDGLSSAARELVASAEVIVGGDRHHNLAGNGTARRIAWPSPFDAMIDTLKGLEGQRVVVLVTGDPLWYSVGARILKQIPSDQIIFHPQLSAFQWSSCRMGWSLADVETLTVHGRAAEQILPYLAPEQRMIVLTKDRTSPKTIGDLLTTRGYGKSRLTVLAALGGDNEQRIDMLADAAHENVPDFHTLAIECIAGEGAVILPRTGLPDDAFIHDGKMTKRIVRAAALAKLIPVRAGVLWDIGCGCGSIAIEWMRGAPEAMSYGIEPLEKRRVMAAQNALQLGTPKLKLIDGEAPACLAELPAPDAVFIGGGIDPVTIDKAICTLKPLGRLVSHAVTLESEQALIAAYQRHGGELQRISVETLEPVGPYHGFKPSMSVLQWAWEKR